MTPNTTNDYWISPKALTIALNAMAMPDYIQAGCVSNAQILVYIKGIISYDAGHNYRRWALTASPTAFSTHTPKYVYAAIPRDENNLNAQIVFPSEYIDIYGKAERTNAESGAVEEVQVGSADYYYIFLQGIITSSGDNGTTSRQWEQRIVTGTLDTNESINAGPTESAWYEYSSVDGITTIIKDITQKAGTQFRALFAKALTVVTGGSINFEQGGEVNGVVSSDTSLESTDKIVTPKFLDDKSLSKAHDDKTEFDIELKNLKANGSADIFGNFTVRSNAHFNADVDFGTFAKGILTGTGAQIDKNGNAELESLVIRKFLEVPELRYNRVSVHSGTEWFTKGSGIIESVKQIDDTHGKVKLHLEDGEISTIAVDDYCMGIFHNLSGNATESSDDKQGTMQYAGFCTVYFRIQEITETAHNSEFIYELRPVSEAWSHSIHPQPQMTFACYANPNNTDRQSAVLKTTDYTVYIEKSTQWTFGPDNYYLIMGQLEGFSVWATNQNGQKYLKQLSGNGTMLGNVYMFGTIDQFDRLADYIDVTVSPRINADYSLAEDETMTLTARMLSYDGNVRSGVTYSIKRFSDNTDADAQWNEQRGNDISSGTIDLTVDDTLIGEGIYDPAVQFTITATRQIPTTNGGTEAYSVEHDVVVRNVGGNTLSDDNLDPMIALGETKHYNFKVTSARGADITSKITRWTIYRSSSDATADEVWLTRDKVKSFSGSIDLLWSSDPAQNDMDPNETYNTTRFIITAYIGTAAVAQEEIEI